MTVTSRPITGELRDAMPVSYGHVDMEATRFDQLCDAIDSIHANLERENTSLKAELDRVIGEQEEHAHTMGKSITGELRKVAAKTECANGRCEKLYRGDLDHIADRIDAEHEAKVSYWQGASYKDGYDEGFASADDWLGQHEDAMAEHGWVRLPLDADGEYIHIGDVMVYADGNTCPLPVVALVPPAVFLTDDGPRYADMCRHAPDTWERIIEDAIIYAASDTKGDRARFDALVARCRALAGDAS